MVSFSATLYTLTFAFMLAFLTLVVGMLFLISLLRQAQLQTQEEWLAGNYRINPVVVRRYVHLVSAPTDKVIPWYVRLDDTSTGLPKYSGAQLILGPVIAPLRPQESLLYADTFTQPAARTPQFPLTA